MNFIPAVLLLFIISDQKIMIDVGSDKEDIDSKIYPQHQDDRCCKASVKRLITCGAINVDCKDHGEDIPHNGREQGPWKLPDVRELNTWDICVDHGEQQCCAAYDNNKLKVNHVLKSLRKGWPCS